MPKWHVQARAFCARATGFGKAEDWDILYAAPANNEPPVQVTWREVFFVLESCAYWI